MKRGVRKRAHENLSDANIRRVISALEEGSTKKSACEMLNISYNTTRLNRIIEEFEEQESFVAMRKLQTKGKPASPEEIKQVIQDYVEGENISDIAKSILIVHIKSIMVQESFKQLKLFLIQDMEKVSV